MLNLYVQSFAHQGQWPFQCCLACGHTAGSLHSLVTHPIHEAELWLACSQPMGGPQTCTEASRPIFVNPPPWRKPKCRHILKLMVSSMSTATWFQMRGNPNTLATTQSGTRPKDSMADLLYADPVFDFECVGLHTTFELHWIPACTLQPGEIPDCQITDFSWVDDFVLLLQAGMPESLLQKTQQALTLSIVYDQAPAPCLRLNLGQDKTSVVLSLRGATFRNFGLRFSVMIYLMHPELTFTCRALTKPASVSIAYLGAVQDQQGHPACEVKRRLLSIQAARKMLNKNVPRCPQMPASTGRLLLKPLMLGKMMLSAEFKHGSRYIHTARS